MCMCAREQAHMCTHMSTCMHMWTCVRVAHASPVLYRHRDVCAVPERERVRLPSGRVFGYTTISKENFEETRAIYMYVCTSACVCIIEKDLVMLVIGWPAVILRIKCQCSIPVYKVCAECFNTLC